MLRFLRRIRQKLLFNGNFKKYFAYAIGEILLVTFGILLAFQINQWSEDQKAKKLERDLLSDIHDGLSQDLVVLQKNLEFQANINHSQNMLLTWIDGEGEYHDSLSPHWAMGSLYSNFQAHLGPFETLKQYGLKNIKNDSLRLQITQLYEYAYPDYHTFLEVYRRAMSETAPHMEKYLQELTWEPTSIIKVHNPNKLRKDIPFRFRLGTLQNIGESLPIWRTPQLMNQIEQTLEALRVELSKK